MTETELLAAAFARIATLTSQVAMLEERVAEAQHRADVADGITAMLVDSGLVTLPSLLATGSDR